MKTEELKYRKYPQVILWCGYLVSAWGGLGLIVDHVARSRSLYPFNHGIILGLSAHVLIGVIAVMTARSLIDIEHRLRRIEAMDELTAGAVPKNLPLR